MLRSLPFGRTVLFLVGLAFLALVGVGGASFWLAEQVQADAGRMAASDLTRGQALQVYIALREAEAGQRGFLVTKDPQFLQPFQTGKVGGPAALNRLARLTADDPAQQTSVAEIRPLLTRRFEDMQRTIDLARAGRSEQAVRLVRVNQARNLTFRIGQILGVMIERETAALQTEQVQAARYSQWLSIANLSAVVGVSTLALVTLALIGRALAELRSAGRELRRTNEGLEAAVEIRTREIRQANEEIQRFAYIVSHDLRSPLVNVMGFTAELEAGGEAIRRQLSVVRDRAPELLDPEAVAAAEEDLPESVGFIRSSTAKMDRLISAILKLSRDGRRTLTPAPVSMQPLLEQVAASLRVVADRAGAEIAIEEVPDLVTDRLAVEQIFSNLIENAVKYLQPGRPGRIVVRGRSRGVDVAYDVEDNGRGIDAKDHARVFELFRRAGAQDQAGEGLGLAFVQTNVRRLGGSIQLRSTPGEGSTFTVILPKVLQLASADKSDIAA